MRRLEQANKFKLVLSIKALVFLLVRAELLNVRFWPKADMPKNAIDVAIGGKADMAIALQNVCF